MTTLSPPIIAKPATSNANQSSNGSPLSSNGAHLPLNGEVASLRRYVSKEEYWAKYYESEHNYEWNNGYLEEKPMSTRVQSYLLQWFLGVVRQYVETHEGHDLMIIDIGFEMTVPNPDKPQEMKEVIRKPDLAVITPDNPMRWGDEERSYRGLCDFCVESLSDSDKKELERDTKIKKAEYEFAGVREYYILDPSDKEMHFYQRTPAGKYQEIVPDADGVIHSQVLKGFQFRKSDLNLQPTLEELAIDPVYQNYILLGYQAALAKAEREELRAEHERQRAEHEQQRAEHERQEKERYAAILRELGVQIE